MVRYRHALHVAGIWAKVNQILPNLFAVHSGINIPTDRMTTVQIYSIEVLQLHEGLNEYSDASEPGVRRVRATVPAPQSQCSGQ